MKSDALNKWPARKVSRTVFYALLAVIAIVFGLFYTVGYAQPFEDNPEYNAPLFSGLVVVFTLSFVVIAAVLLLAMLAVSAKRRRRERLTADGARSSHIAMVVAVATALALAASFILGSLSPLLINGADYDNAFWLKASDMFVYTIAVMLLAAIAAVMLGKASHRRSGTGTLKSDRVKTIEKPKASDGQRTDVAAGGGQEAAKETNRSQGVC